jgi:hypothetical protein
LHADRQHYGGYPLALASELTGTRLGKGEQPYQSFALLIELRNRLVHGRPPQMRFVNNVAQPLPADQKFVKRLIAAGAGSSTYSTAPDWEAIAWNPKCAQWAFRTARGLISHLINAFPSENIRNSLRVSFEPIDIHETG